MVGGTLKAQAFWSTTIGTVASQQDTERGEEQEVNCKTHP